jgi:hypothetical protein
MLETRVDGREFCVQDMLASLRIPQYRLSDIVPRAVDFSYSAVHCKLGFDRSFTLFSMHRRMTMYLAHETLRWNSFSGLDGEHVALHVPQTPTHGYLNSLPH